MKIKFKNYKSFEGYHEVNLKAFNVFIGKNNAGKSSLSEIIKLSNDSAFGHTRFVNSLGKHNILFNRKETVKVNPLLNYSDNDYRLKANVKLEKLIKNILDKEFHICLEESAIKEVEAKMKTEEKEFYHSYGKSLANSLKEVSEWKVSLKEYNNTIKSMDPKVISPFFTINKIVPRLKKSRLFVRTLTTKKTDKAFLEKINSSYKRKSELYYMKNIYVKGKGYDFKNFFRPMSTSNNALYSDHEHELEQLKDMYSELFDMLKKGDFPFMLFYTLLQEKNRDFVFAKTTKERKVYDKVGDILTYIQSKAKIFTIVGFVNDPILKSIGLKFQMEFKHDDNIALNPPREYIDDDGNMIHSDISHILSGDVLKEIFSPYKEDKKLKSVLHPFEELIKKGNKIPNSLNAKPRRMTLNSWKQRYDKILPRINNYLHGIEFDKVKAETQSPRIVRDEDNNLIGYLDCELNVRDHIIDINYKSPRVGVSKKRNLEGDIQYPLFDGVRIRSLQTDDNPLLSYEYESDIYKRNTDFVFNLLMEAAPTLSQILNSSDAFHKIDRKNINSKKVPGKKIRNKIRSILDPIFHEANITKFPTKLRSKRKIFPECLIVHLYNHNTYSNSLNNLPFKIKPTKANEDFFTIERIKRNIDLKNNMITSELGIPNERVDEFRGLIAEYPPLNNQFKNDVHFILKSDYINSIRNHEKHRIRKRFAYMDYLKFDIENNKIFTKSVPDNPFVIDNLPVPPRDRDRTGSRIIFGGKQIARGYDGRLYYGQGSPLSFYQKLLSLAVNLFEFDERFKQTLSERRSPNSRKLKEARAIDKFIAGAVLSSSASHMFSLINDYLLDFYNRTIFKEKNIIIEDFYGRRTTPIVQTNIIDPFVSSSKKIKQTYTKSELKLLFGQNIESLLNSSPTAGGEVDKLCRRVNRHLAEIGLFFDFNISRVITDTENDNILRNVNEDELEFVLSVREHSNETDANNPWVDFDQVGQGTQSLIAVFTQIECNRRRARNTDKKHLIIIREPENYLHPSLIGKFVRHLIKITNRESIGIVLETHSEIILRQLQVMIKQDISNSNSEGVDFNDEGIMVIDNEEFLDAPTITNKDLSIYYIEKSDDGSGSKIEELTLDNEGYFEKGIPEDFYDINSKLAGELL